MELKPMTEIEKKAKELQADYHRKWRAKNKEKVAAINKRYWKKKAAALIEREKQENEAEAEGAKE